ncbi:type II toxin-antitoxin system death-on-curing family toxin [Sphingoaurantiacus capsulatus]|uniref:Type II toxin-antitoxin system death-on-curing family toxin n=1 Tax=Sphingoaurantiacus capsulatus TaxID=1771310 RepID=A0ABV7X7X1_9SPHN
MTDWIWIDAEIAEAVHSEQLAEHGGPAGTRDHGALESALARPVNLAAYGEPDLAELAATYAFGIARNHPFVDGNKRTAWIVARLFVRLNGGQLSYDREDAYRTVIALAAGQLSEAVLADWLRQRLNGVT